MARTKQTFAYDSMLSPGRVRGQQGPTGPTGPTGATGPTGLNTGVTGPIQPIFERVRQVQVQSLRTIISF